MARVFEGQFIGGRSSARQHVQGPQPRRRVGLGRSAGLRSRGNRRGDRGGACRLCGMVGAALHQARALFSKRPPRSSRSARWRSSRRCRPRAAAGSARACSRPAIRPRCFMPPRPRCGSRPARCCRPNTASSRWRYAGRWAWSRSSARGISPASCRRAASRFRSRPATRSCSSRRKRRPIAAACCSPRYSRRPACRRAYSTSSPARARTCRKSATS